MALVPLYRDLLKALETIPPGSPAWPRLATQVYVPHQAFFDGLTETYGPEQFGPFGLPSALEQMAPALRQALAPAPSYQLERSASALLDLVSPLLPGTPPDLYLGTLCFMAPAGTISVRGRPTIALGLERFHPSPPPGPQKIWYHPSEVVEMIPHEAAHAARMQVLNLPPTPRGLSLLEMVMLEGTALTFTDGLLGRKTLATFMPAPHLAWHRQHDAAVRAALLPAYGTGGMEAFRKYFSADSPISGYYVGYSLCREYLDRFGPSAMRELIGLPSAEILRRLA